MIAKGIGNFAQNGLVVNFNACYAAHVSDNLSRSTLAIEIAILNPRFKISVMRVTVVCVDLQVICVQDCLDFFWR